MAVRDWSRVNTNLLQHFHGQWISELVDTLNAGLLPEGYFATGQQTAGVHIPGLLANREPTASNASRSGTDGGILLSSPPQTSIVEMLDEIDFTRRQRSVIIQHADGREVAAIVEIVSAGNKASERALRQFLRKTTDAVLQGCHLLVIDLHPPTSRDPQGIHNEIWQELGGKPYTAPPGKPLTLVSYDALPFPIAYVEPIGTGDSLPSMPLFLRDELYVRVPLEASYMAVTDKLPRPLKVELDR